MGRPAQISREAVLAAGLAIADAEGLEAVTMQGVALRLGVTPMALYRHVADKADLLDGLVERLLGEVATGASDGSWEERLRRLGRSVRGVARRHPNVFPLLLQRPATTPAALGGPGPGVRGAGGRRPRRGTGPAGRAADQHGHPRVRGERSGREVPRPLPAGHRRRLRLPRGRDRRRPARGSP